MNMELPSAVIVYFEISNGADPARVADCFKDDAIVIDERKQYRGLEAIEFWQRQVREASAFKVTPLEVSGSALRLMVKARVEGEFPGSPLQLGHLFGLDNDRIVSLEIRP